MYIEILIKEVYKHVSHLLFSLQVECLFMIGLVVFDIYCLAEASPGSRHYRYFGISFLFVYSGNQHGKHLNFSCQFLMKCDLSCLLMKFNFAVRNLLILVSVMSFIGAAILLFCSAHIISALRKEQEAKFRPWLWAMAGFTIWRFVAIIFRSIANVRSNSTSSLLFLEWLKVVKFICLP